MVEAGEPSPSIDVAHPPLGENAARHLVEALAQTDDRAERHYLEIKSHVDLSTTLGAAKVAKFILGAANRSVDLAARAFGGYGVLVIGIEPGGTPGVRPIEVGEIETRLRPFLSPSGPRWDIVRVAVRADRDVLLIVVDPPQRGQGPFLCWKEFSPEGPDRKHGLRDGGIYVRTEGSTRPATAEEVTSLVERGANRGPEVDLDVSLEGTAFRPPTSTEPLTAYVSRVTKSLMAKAPGPEPMTVERALTASERAALSSMRDAMAKVRFSDIFGADPEDRTVDAYTAEVEAWTQSAHDAIPELVDRLVARAVPPIAIKVTNRERTYFEDAELTVHLEGAVDGIAPREGKLGHAAWPPTPPRAWGPRPRPSYLESARFATPVFPSSAPHVPSRLTWTNGGSISATWDIGDLRPKEAIEVDSDEAFIVLARDPAIDVVRGSWTLTAKGHHTLYEGSLVLPVADDTPVRQAIDDFIVRISR